MRVVVLALAQVAALGVGALAQGATPVVTRRLTIGCESCGDATQFGSIWDVSVSAQGDVLVTDRDPPMLRRFDLSGKPVWTGGRKGKGPGEYSLPVRAALMASGVTVVDMTNLRVTDLSAAGALSASTPLTDMPTAASVNDRGDLLIGTDGFRGTITLHRREPGGRLKEVRSIPGSRMTLSVALASDGASAVTLDTRKYEILRFDAAGQPMPAISRAIAQVRRTPEEEADFRARKSRALGMVAAEAKSAGGTPSIPVFKPEELSLKDHLRIDGLRFDGAGRLWVLTQRGDSRTTIFDVFSGAGAFVGSVTLPGVVTSYSLSRGWMVTGGENSDGVPVVTVWRVTQ